MTVRTEMKMPEAPTPCTARPKMRTLTVGLTPQMRLPISKTVIATR